MKAKHTPGLWHLEASMSGAYFVKASKPEYGGSIPIASVFSTNNAHLIAAAPDLLEAVNVLMTMDVKGHQLQDRLQFSTEGRAILDKVSAAIVKATGGAA